MPCSPLGQLWLPTLRTAAFPMPVRWQSTDCAAKLPVSGKAFRFGGHFHSILSVNLTPIWFRSYA